MRKGFTMIELIFVIVILGILAAVAIPRLTATRDDAEISAAATNISTAIGDLNAYYTSQGKLSKKWGDMTSVPMVIKIRQEACLTFAAPANETDVVVTATPSTASTGLCAKVWALPSMTEIKSYIASTDGGKAANQIKVGGLSVVR